ncbi:hypothetical protein [uncultured Brevundimonas sp.]|uniref:hypothetical protein n=1 Tax=uncultured Brevundimonas sp. TaxID=213418 RepID=UPI0025F01DD0|nr:hypothetical protein [uncultured Brevundimonas sp.]
MIKTLTVSASFALAICVGSLAAPEPAKASGASDYAVEQCGNGAWEDLGYPSYEDCYTRAVQFYFEQSGGGGGGGGGTWIPDLPGWTPGSGWGCGATHLPCNPGN